MLICQILVIPAKKSESLDRLKSRQYMSNGSTCSYYRHGLKLQINIGFYKYSSFFTKMNLKYTDIASIISLALLLTQQPVVYTQKEEVLPCEDPNALGCPDILCRVMNSGRTDFCQEIQCEGIAADDCRNSGSSYEREITMCGCCGGCVKYLEAGEPCEVSPPQPSLDPNCTDPFCPILANRCRPGLGCNYLGEPSKVCAAPEQPGAWEESSVEDSEKSKCEYKRALFHVGRLHWEQRCEPDGSYSPKQCKGSPHGGDCFCVDRDGKRIFGREWWVDAANQTCECSRHVHKLRDQQINNIASFHCSPDRNYEPLQCDTGSGLCYCVDPQSGRLDGALLPQHQWKQLPCYSLNHTGFDPTGTYLRLCESEWAAGQLVSQEANLHGLRVLSGRDLNCDYDGSFAPVQRIGSEDWCVKPDWTELAHHQLVSQSYMDCQCYRDSILYEKEGRTFLKTCDQATGNYDETAIFDPDENTYKCIDLDGFDYGDEVPERYRCCLIAGNKCSGESDAIKSECYDPETKRGKFRSCTLWPK